MQFGLIILLSIQLLSRIVILDGLRVQVHQVLHIVRGREVDTLLDLHFELKDTAGEVDGQILLLQVEDLRLLFLLEELLLLELMVEPLKIYGSPLGAAELLQLIIC